MEKKVGAFVIISTVLLFAVIFTLGGDKAFFTSYARYKILLEETSGLGVGGVVQVGGIPAGNVTGIEFDTNSNKLEVTIKVDKKYQKKITKGSTAAIRTQGALGDKFVMIRPATDSTEFIENNGFILAEEGSDFLSAIGKSGSKLEKGFEIIEHINKIVSDLDQGGFAKNMSDSSRSLKNTLSKVDESLMNQKLKKSIEHLESILEKIDKGQGTLGGLVNDPTVHEDLKSILGGAKRSNLLKYLIRSTIQKSEDEQDKANKK